MSDPSARPEAATVDLLRRLTLAHGAPGAEDSVREIVRESLAGMSGLAFSHDRLGSILAEKRGESAGPRVMIDAHLDEVAFLVQSIGEEGALSFVPLGGWWGHVLLAQRVEVVTSRGAVPGIIGSKPPHFLSPEERKAVMSIDDMFIDVGARSAEEARDFGVQVGDPVVPRGDFLALANPRLLSSKAFDNRVGVALLVEALLGLEHRSHPNTVIGVGAVQEEVGCRGAGTAVHLARPDVGLILEGTPADDTPGFPPSTRQARLGGGPQIRFFDPTAMANRSLVKLVIELAGRQDIPVQLAVRRSGGTDAKSVHLHREGVPTVVIGVPARYIHTHASVIHLDDLLTARRLVVELVEALDAAAVRSLTQ